MARHHPQTQHPQTAMAQTHWVQTEPSHFRHHPQVEASDGTGTPVLLVLRRSKSGITITRSGGGVHGFFSFVVFSSTTSNGDVPENATMSQVSAAATTKVTRL